MFRIIIALTICSCLSFLPAIGICQSNSLEEIKIQNNDIDKIDISVNIKPVKDSQYCYNFRTNSESQIDYIIHILNAIDFIDDGKTIDGADIPIVNINFTKADNSIDKYGFVSGRFYDTKNKQYAVDRSAYNRFLDFIYALKTEKLVLTDNITFEPSEWAKNDIKQAIEGGLVPKWNQINYKGSIIRLEGCELVANLLGISCYDDFGSEENPFSDTNDKSVVSLYNLKIINGKSETLFCPYDFMTREEFAKILSNTYFQLIDKRILHNKKISYKDQDKISDWAIDSVTDMTSLGMFKGNENGEFEPQKNITKEEVILTLLRLSKLEK